MKCPKCGYQSFNNLTACKKCGRDLTEIQAKLNFGSPVVPAPAENPAEDLLSSAAEPTSSSPTAARDTNQTKPTSHPQVPEEEDGEHLLEDFFQAIDSPADNQPLPTASTIEQRPSTAPEESRISASEVADDFPQWDQETPQSDFPFDELDADLDALRISATPEQTSEEGSPFDDVDTFELDWQLPAEEQAATEPEPAAIKTDPAEPPAATDEWTQMELPAAAETAAQQQTEPVEAESSMEQEETLADHAAAEPVPAEEEWPLPKLPTGHQGEEGFSMTEPLAEESPGEELESVAEEPVLPIEETDLFAEEPEATEKDLLPDACIPPPELEEQEELPLAARQGGIPAERADIPAVFLPGAEQDPLAAGALLLARRAKAYLTDLGVLAAIFALFVCAGEVARLPAAGERFRFSSDVLLDLATPYFLVFFALCFGYFTFFHYLSGQTPGKMLFDVRVEGDDHAAITLAQAFLRCVGGLISLLPVGLGYLSIVLDGAHRGWNDRLAGCRVVMVNEEEGVEA